MVQFYKKTFGTISFLERRNDGASAFHLAGLCNRNNIVKEITNGFSEDLTQLALHNLQDRAGRNILHYVASIQQQSVLLHENYRQNSMLSVFLYFAKFINLTDVDFQGNSAAHFLVQNGHLDILEYYLKTLTTANFRAIMILPRNNQGRSPAEFGLIQAPVSSLVVTSDLFYVFRNKPAVPFEKIERLQNTCLWEVCLIMLAELMTEQEIETFAETNTRLMVRKAPFLTKAVFRRINLKQINGTVKDTIRKSIIDSVKFSKSLTSSSLFSISLVKASIFHTCSVPLLVSPIHYMILNSLEYDTSVFNTSVIETILKSIKNKEKLNCRTSEGYNVLHYALIGGNINLVIRLKSEGVQLLTENLTAVDILYRLSHARFITGKSSFEIVDRFASDFIEENQGDLRVTDFCYNGSRSLSLIHILVINGMNKTIEKIVDIFGMEVLRCTNMHGFSSGYFALLFDRNYIKLLISKNHTTYTEPTIDSEEWLIANLINKFPLMRHKSAYTSLIMTSTPMNAVNTRSLIKLYRNLVTLFKTEHISCIIHDFFRKSLIYLRQGLYLFRKLFISTKTLQNYAIKMIKTETEVCDWYFVAMQSVRRALINLQHWREIQHSALLWTKEYPFLRKIQKILRLPEKSMTLLPEYSKISCNGNGQKKLIHVVIYLQKVSNLFMINMKNIYLFLNLVDQKSVTKWINVPVTFSYELTDRFTGCLGFENMFGIGGLTTGAVYKIGRFSYLNQIKATSAYREILGRWYNTMLFKGNHALIQRQIKELKGLLTNTTLRTKWIAKEFKCENVTHPRGCVEAQETLKENEETKEYFELNIPYI